MKPEAIDDEMWNELYEVYVKEKYDLGVQDYFVNEDHAALEEMTAVMMETARKGMWKATDEQLSDIANLHTDLVNKYKPSCSGFVCDNTKLRQYIASQVNEQTASQYTQNIAKVREARINNADQSIVMKKEDMSSKSINEMTNDINGTVILLILAVAIIAMILFVKKRRKMLND